MSMCTNPLVPIVWGPARPADILPGTLPGRISSVVRRCTARGVLGMLVLVLLTACQTNKTTGQGDTAATLKVEAARDAPLLEGDEVGRLLRSTERNVRHFFELRLQGKTEVMVTLRRTLGRTVDQNFATFRDVALNGEFLLHRNTAVKCIGFAIRKRKEAQSVLLKLYEDKDITIVQNAAYAVGLLQDPETDLTPIVALMGRGDVNVRTNAASSLGALFLIKPTPRELPPQYWSAIDRLVALLHDKTSIRGRRAAAWALANLRHPDVLEHLLGALQDSDETVQIGGLHGLERLGDQRALDPVIEYLRGGPTTQGASWARKVLIRIAVQGGFAKIPSELDELGTDPKSWTEWFRAARMK